MYDTYDILIAIYFVYPNSLQITFEFRLPQYLSHKFFQRPFSRTSRKPSLGDGPCARRIGHFFFGKSLRKLKANLKQHTNNKKTSL